MPHKRRRRAISMGIELEAYSIAVPEYRITRELHFPRKAAIEPGERFSRDVTIGTEYNSKVFTTIHEAFFLLKNGLRKYIYNRAECKEHSYHTVFPVGGWIDRFAGCHLHLALGKDRFDFQQAKELAARLHDHIPFLIALSANSPVWRERIEDIDSNRLLRGTQTYCQVTKRGLLYKHHYRELTFNAGGKRKPNTLEIRVLDSGIPEYIAAALCVANAVALHWLKRRGRLNQSTHRNYLKARDQAVRRGARARLVWNNHWMNVARYTDLFFRKYREELEQMNIPDDVLRIFKYLKKGWNQAELIRRAALKARKRNRQTWQRQFAKRYTSAIQTLLDGNSYSDFAKALGVKVPDIHRVWLGKREMKW